ncbi:hypothetical protein ACFX11_046842 [Malus domestica]
MKHGANYKTYNSENIWKPKSAVRAYTQFIRCFPSKVFSYTQLSVHAARSLMLQTSIASRTIQAGSLPDLEGHLTGASLFRFLLPCRTPMSEISNSSAFSYAQVQNL